MIKGRDHHMPRVQKPIKISEDCAQGDLLENHEASMGSKASYLNLFYSVNTTLVLMFIHAMSYSQIKKKKKTMEIIEV